MSDKFEKTYYMTMADGETLRVPESKLNEFRTLNEKIKAEMQQKDKAKSDVQKYNFEEATRLAEELFAQEVCATNIRIRDLAWLEDSPEVEARIRYKSPAVKGVINFDLGIKDFEFNTLNSKLTIHFSTPVWGVTPGQSLVIYKDGLVVGGGFIYLP